MPAYVLNNFLMKTITLASMCSLRYFDNLSQPCIILSAISILFKNFNSKLLNWSYSYCSPSAVLKSQKRK